MILLYTGFSDDENCRSYFEKVYFQYRSQMINIANQILHNYDDSEDAVHDVFCNIAAKHMHILYEIQNDNDLKNYLFKATKNTAINILKKRKQTPLYLDALDEDFSGIPELSDNDFLDTICSKFDYDTILEAISDLPDTYRDVMYYHFVLEFTVSRISKSCGLKVSTVKKQLVRGKKKLLSKINITGE